MHAEWLPKGWQSFFKFLCLWNGLSFPDFPVFTMGGVPTSGVATLLSWDALQRRLLGMSGPRRVSSLVVSESVGKCHGLMSFCCPSFRDWREWQEHIYQADENHPRVGILRWRQKGLHQAGVSEHLHGHAGYDPSHGHAQDPLQVRAQ